MLTIWQLLKKLQATHVFIRCAPRFVNLLERLVCVESVAVVLGLHNLQVTRTVLTSFQDWNKRFMVNDGKVKKFFCEKSF